MTQIQAPEEKQVVLVLDDDLLITEALALGLEQEGRTVITCNDLESAQRVLERMSPSHVVTDLQLSGSLSLEGLEFIQFAKDHSPNCLIIVMTGDTSEELHIETSARGANAFLQKPFELSELETLLDLL